MLIFVMLYFSIVLFVIVLWFVSFLSTFKFLYALRGSCIMRFINVILLLLLFLEHSLIKRNHCKSCYIKYCTKLQMNKIRVPLWKYQNKESFCWKIEDLMVSAVDYCIDFACHSLTLRALLLTTDVMCYIAYLTMTDLQHYNHCMHYSIRVVYKACPVDAWKL